MSKVQLGLLALVLTSVPALAAKPNRKVIAEGQRLVEKVGLCADCHSPRNVDGSFVQEKWLQGSPLAFAPTVPMPWAPYAPGIAGLPTMTDEQAVHFLMTGDRPNGAPLPPMPPYRLSKPEAQAVVAYLRSLPAAAVEPSTHTATAAR